MQDAENTAITNLCGSGVSEETIRAIAGHLFQRMLQPYAHIRTAAKRMYYRGLLEKPGLRQYRASSY